MITCQRISSYVFAEPFHPFRITLADGRTVDIRHPDSVQVGRTWMTIFLYDCKDPEDRRLAVPLRDMESVEQLDAAACGRGAGSGPATVEGLRAFRAARPFRPFYIEVADGSRHEIRDPDLITIQQTRCIVLHGRHDSMAILDIKDMSEAGPIDK